MAEGTIGDIIKGKPSQGRPLRFALAWSLDMARWEEAFRAKHGPDRPFLAWHHVDSFRLAVADLHYGLALNPDGSSFDAVRWELHEKELAVLTLQYSATLTLAIVDPAAPGDPGVAVKSFRDGAVYDWPEGPGPALVTQDQRGRLSVARSGSDLSDWPEWPSVLKALVPRSPRPCPHPPEVEAAPA